MHSRLKRKIRLTGSSADVNLRRENSSPFTRLKIYIWTSNWTVCRSQNRERTGTRRDVMKNGGLKIFMSKFVFENL